MDRLDLHIIKILKTHRNLETGIFQLRGINNYAWKCQNCGSYKEDAKRFTFGIRVKSGKWEPLKIFEFMEMDKELDFSVRYTEITRKYE